MKIAEALKILAPMVDNTRESLKNAYRAACKKYHPDVNPEGLELMKLVNAAYDLLLEHYGKWDVSDVKDCEQNIAEIFADILSKIRHIPGLEIECCGTWMYVSGEGTRGAKDILKAEGMRWSAQKVKWYWKPADAKKYYKHKAWDMGKIRGTFGSVHVGTQEYDRIGA